MRNASRESHSRSTRRYATGRLTAATHGRFTAVSTSPAAYGWSTRCSCPTSQRAPRGRPLASCLADADREAHEVEDGVPRRSRSWPDEGDRSAPQRYAPVLSDGGDARAHPGTGAILRTRPSSPTAPTWPAQLCNDQAGRRRPVLTKRARRCPCQVSPRAARVRADRAPAPRSRAVRRAGTGARHVDRRDGTGRTCQTTGPPAWS